MRISSGLTVSVLGAMLVVLALRRVSLGEPDPAKDWPKPALHAGRSDAQLTSAILDHAKQLYDTRHFSGVVLVARAGKPVASQAYGLADVAANTPNTLDTAFNIGSINKVFTRLAIAQLAAAGKLALDDTLHTRLPDLRLPGADQITLRQLLDHRSGLGDIFGPKYEAAPPSRLRELADFVPLFADQPLGFAPGSSERYSNAGFVVLGLVIERVSGEKYRDYVVRHIFTPAKMASSGFWAVDEHVAHRATGYTLHGPDRELTARIPNTATLPGRPSSAGGAFATAGDLLRFYNALLADQLLDARWTSWMINDSFDNPGRKPEIGVAGGAPGINAAIELSGDWMVIALANYDPPAAGAVARGAMELLRGRRDDRGGDGGGVRRRPPSAPGKTELTGEVVVATAMSGHQLTVEARVNGRGPFRFAIDSGAAGMLHLGSKLATTLGLPQIGEAMTGDPSGKRAARRPVVHVDTVELGGAKFTGVDAVVGDHLGDDAISGVIGLALFAGLTATLDYPGQKLRLGRQPLAAGGPHVVAFTGERGVPVIDIEVAGVAMKIDVDTGSPAVLSLPPALSGKLTFAAPPRVVGEGRTTANEFELRAAELRGDLRVAGFAQANPTVDLVELFPVGNLGARFLRDYVVTFDLVNHRLALTQPARP